MSGKRPNKLAAAVAAVGLAFAARPDRALAALKDSGGAPGSHVPGGPGLIEPVSIQAPIDGPRPLEGPAAPAAPAVSAQPVMAPAAAVEAAATAAHRPQVRLLLGETGGLAPEAANDSSPSAALSASPAESIRFDGERADLGALVDHVAVASRLRGALKAGDVAGTQVALKAVKPADLAEAWKHLSTDERGVLFRLLARPRSNQVFEELDQAHQKELLDWLQQDHAAELVQGLEPAVVARLSKRIPASRMSRLISVMNRGRQETVLSFAQHPASTVGAMMRSRYLTLEPGWTSRQAMDRVRMSTKLRHIDETHLDTLIVVDPTGKLLGVVGLKTIVAAPNTMKVAELMDRAPQVLSPRQDQEEAVKLFDKYHLESAPVVDADGVLVGIVVSADVRKVARLENEEDHARMAGVEAGLLAKSVWVQTLLRSPWLVITLGGEMLVALVVGHFENVLTLIPALAAFIPLISALGGNVGSQTATLFVRAIATGEIKTGTGRKHLLKEVAVGALLGLAYGSVLGIAAFALYGLKYGPLFPVIIGSTMFVSMTVGAIAGAIEPFFFRKLGVDPATGTGPLIATLIDLIANSFYLVLASKLLL